MSTSATPHILILGGGYVGLYTAWGIRKRLGPEAARITVVEPNSYMTYQPLLPEVGGGEIEPRIVTVNLRSALKNVDIVRGKLVSLDVHAKTATLREIGGGDRSLAYDQVVFAVGAVTRTFPTPGLEEHGVGFKTVEEAIYCRGQGAGQRGAGGRHQRPGGAGQGAHLRGGRRRLYRRRGPDRAERSVQTRRRRTPGAGPLPVALGADRSAGPGGSPRWDRTCPSGRWATCASVAWMCG